MIRNHLDSCFIVPLSIRRSWLSGNSLHAKYWILLHFAVTIITDTTAQLPDTVLDITQNLNLPPFSAMSFNFPPVKLGILLGQMGFTVHLTFFIPEAH
ncbi:MAG: hypothetical protein K2Q45_07545, partial [Nitrosomonas sp.]|nr:hypothetical protein [Nitrosomonas sp.]